MGKTLAEVQTLLGTEVQAGDPTMASLETLPRPTELDQAASQQVQQAHADSRLESGLLLSNGMQQSHAVAAPRQDAVHSPTSGLNFFDRIRLQWTNWTGYKQYRDMSDPPDGR